MTSTSSRSRVPGPARRQALAEWAAQRGTTIIEDDYDAEFRYDREPVGALQGLAPEHVATIGTVSKSLAPIAAEKELTDRGSPGLDQLALAALIESGRAAIGDLLSGPRPAAGATGR